MHIISVCLLHILSAFIFYLWESYVRRFMCLQIAADEAVDFCKHYQVFQVML
jgi:hypothetical protein